MAVDRDRSPWSRRERTGACSAGHGEHEPGAPGGSLSSIDPQPDASTSRGSASGPLYGIGVAEGAVSGSAPGWLGLRDRGSTPGSPTLNPGNLSVLGGSAARLQGKHSDGEAPDGAQSRPGAVERAWGWIPEPGDDTEVDSSDTSDQSQEHTPRRPEHSQRNQHQGGKRIGALHRVVVDPDGDVTLRTALSVQAPHGP